MCLIYIVNYRNRLKKYIIQRNKNEKKNRKSKNIYLKIEHVKKCKIKVLKLNT